MRAEVIPVKHKKRSKRGTYLTTVGKERVWLWQRRRDMSLFYWGLALVSVLAGFSAAVMACESEMHIRVVAGLTIWHLVRRVVGRITEPT